MNLLEISNITLFVLLLIFLIGYLVLFIIVNRLEKKFPKLSNEHYNTSSLKKKNKYVRFDYLRLVINVILIVYLALCIVNRSFIVEWIGEFSYTVISILITIWLLVPTFRDFLLKIKIYKDIEGR